MSHYIEHWPKEHLITKIIPPESDEISKSAFEGNLKENKQINIQENVHC